MKIDLGNFRVDVVSDGTFGLDGGAMFGVVPKPLWSKAIEPDSRNRITLALNCLLIRGGDETILVDTGIGHNWSEKERGIFEIRNRPGLLDALADLGVTPESVTIVINTHLHFDHAGGNTIERNGVFVPTFPNATYVVQRGEYEWANQPTRRDRASYRRETFESVEFQLCEGETEIVPGVRVRPVPGHTPNIQAVLIDGASDTLCFPSDLVPTASHVPYPWIMGYDLEPLRTLASKEALFPEAAKKNWIVVFQHEPGAAVGRLKFEGTRPVFEPIG